MEMESRPLAQQQVRSGEMTMVEWKGRKMWEGERRAGEDGRREGEGKEEGRGEGGRERGRRKGEGEEG